MQKRISDNLGIFIISFAFGLLFVITNIFDWDFFLTTIEIDLRSWVVDLLPPSWSYQFCSGSTRAGDPQGYGLSPLIIFPILFNSFWGAKILLFVGTLVGAYYLKKIIQLITPGLSSVDLHSLVFAFLFNNFFLFHFSNGHLSFSSIFYGFPLLYLTLKIVSGNSLSFSELTINSFFLFILLSGPFYQASIYFILPLALSFFILFLWEKRFLKQKDLWLLVCSCFISVILSSYRWLPVHEYQKLFPRTLNTIEWSHLHHMVFSFFVPIQGRDMLWGLPQNAAFGSSENSFFGAIPYLLLIAILIHFRRVALIIKQLDIWIKVSICLILVGVSLSSGNYFSFMPFTIINSLFSNSIRVVGRFNFVTYIGIFILLLSIMRNINFSKRLKRMNIALIAIISLYCCFQHYTLKELKLSLLNTSYMLKADPVYTEKMQTIHIGQSRNLQMSYMYVPVLLGLSLPSCYQPMNRMVYLTNEIFMKETEKYHFHFMYSTDQSEACLENSYFTQSDLYIDKSCKSGSRVHLNFIKPYHLEKFKIKTTNKGYFLE